MHGNRPRALSVTQTRFSFCPQSQKSRPHRNRGQQNGAPVSRSQFWFFLHRAIPSRASSPVFHSRVHFVGAPMMAESLGVRRHALMAPHTRVARRRWTIDIFRRGALALNAAMPFHLPTCPRATPFAMVLPSIPDEAIFVGAGPPACVRSAYASAAPRPPGRERLRRLGRCSFRRRCDAFDFVPCRARFDASLCCFFA